MSTGTPEKSQPASEFLQLERWQGFANAATVALFGMPLIDPTSAARAAWTEMSQLMVGISQATPIRKSSKYLVRHLRQVQVETGFRKQ